MSLFDIPNEATNGSDAAGPDKVLLVQIKDKLIAPVIPVPVELPVQTQTTPPAMPISGGVSGVSGVQVDQQPGIHLTSSLYSNHSSAHCCF